jgi:hypothetical protein
MSLKDALTAPSQLKYDRNGPQQQPAQKAFVAGRRELVKYVPLGYKVRNSGSASNLPVAPWFAILNPELTVTTRAGLYVCYLYDAELKSVFLSMNQGYTSHKDKAKALGFKGKKTEEHARKTLSEESLDLYKGLNEWGLIPKNGVRSIDLNSDMDLPRGYEAGHITGFKYDLKKMPSEEVLLADLESMFTIYDATREINDQLRSLGTSERITVSGNVKTIERPKSKSGISEGLYSPRTSVEYVAHYSSRTFKVSPLHEALLNEFAEQVKPLGWNPVNKKIQNRDMVLKKSGVQEILVEAKTVRQSQEMVVREAIGQLFAYRHVYYSGQKIPLLVLFNRPIAPLWQDLLTSLDIYYIYADHDKQWVGTGHQLLN